MEADDLLNTLLGGNFVHPQKPKKSNVVSIDDIKRKHLRGKAKNKRKLVKKSKRKNRR